MRKKWMPIAAGILDIMSGAFQLLVAVVLFINFMFGTHSGITLSFTKVWFIISAPLALTGTLAMVAGVYLMQGEKRGLVYVGALAASIPLALPVLFLSVAAHPTWAFILLIGIGALVLSLRAEKEFKESGR